MKNTNASSSQAVPRDFRHDINGLRAWAVVAVILYHFGIPGFDGGFVGVDIFFVISGFLMTSIIVRGLDEGRFSLWQFYLARARRIIPALAVLGMVLLMIGWFTLPSTDYRMLGKHVAASLAFISNMVFWSESGYFNAASEDKWLLHTWSLSVEWQFYLILPLVLLGAWRLWPGRARLTLLIALGFVLSLALSIMTTPSHPSAAFFLLPTRAWEMLAGGLVYLLPQLGAVGARQKILERLGLGLIVASIFAFDEGANWPGWGALLPVAGAVLVLLAAQPGSLWTGNRLAQYLGNASYSLYLWHWPVVVALVYLDLKGEAPAVAIGLGLTLLLGHLSYVLVESPTRHHLGRLKMGLGMASLAAATIAVAAPGAAIRLNEGFQHRLPPSIEVVAREAKNRNPRINECHGGSGITSPSCMYGGDKLGAVVMGDSHAESIVTAVEASLSNTDYGVLDLSYTTCPTFLGVHRHPDHPREKSHQCGQFNQWALKKIGATAEHVPLIIMNRTSAYAYGMNESGENKKSPLIYFSKPYGSPEPRFLEEFSEHLIGSACAFAQGREVYLVRPIPEMGIDVPNKMARALMLGHHKDVSITIEEYHKRHAVVWAAQDEANRRCGVKILDPLPYLCDESRCYGSKNGRPLYFDDDHLSEFGNRLLIPMFAEVFVNMDRKTQTARAH